ncbi:MAG: acyl CoA:acetate/3-ketoacid CoA transferase [Deltaproteobacteria bacterium HGW-Deltaproteobacteria-15]|jgi:propionate CoA-transferase|nr:MAG: acyl CoA:acetate/3-ketoacid CoA transferase [Deltaproteobacteria bacterium HGW-Deltaproteobacteria-15]
MDKLCSLDQALSLIKNNDTINIAASGGGFMDADLIYKGIEKKFLDTGEPNNLTIMHVTGVGSGNETGVGRFAHKGLVKRVVGGHWLWSKKMSQLALDEEIEAYNLPQGVLALLTREIAAGRPGLLTTVGLHTFIDPRLDGGRMNKRAQEPLVELVNFQGREMLFYKSFPINVSIVRGTTADEDGNISVELEGLDLHILSSAQAAYNSGGIVIAQVKRIVRRGTLNPRLVRVPGHMVNAVVQDPLQWQTSEGEYNPSICGINKVPMDSITRLEFGIRKFVARRAALELRPGAVVNLGIGIADGVSNIAAEEGILDDFTFSIEMGVVGGVPTKGIIFGAAWNPDCIMSMPSQFDFYHGGGLDMAFLGMGEADPLGNVNVSRLGKRITGSGGFIDISQNAKIMVFCGTFTNGEILVDAKNGKLTILKEGSNKKFRNQVAQVSFSGEFATQKGQQVLFVTERAVLKLENRKMVLTEIAPGIDLQKDILAQMEFTPVIAENLKTMDPAIFKPERMMLNNQNVFSHFGNGQAIQKLRLAS